MNAPVPWQANDFARLVLGQLVCLVAITIAARAAAGRAEVNDQLLWLNIGVFGAIGSGVVNGLWLLRLRRSTGERRRAVLNILEAAADAPVATRGDGGGAALVAVRGMTLAHRPDCALVAGKPVGPADPHSEPCGWCRP